MKRFVLPIIASVLLIAAVLYAHYLNLQRLYQSKDDPMSEMEMQDLMRREHFYLVVSVAAVIIIVLLVIIYRTHIKTVRRNRDLEIARMQEMLMAEKVRNFRARITPHYMMNVLRQISCDRDEVSRGEKIHLLAQTLRSCLELSDQAVVCLKREVDFVHDYLKLRPQKPDFPVSWQIDPDVDMWQTMVPSMIIQLPLENVLKYAYEAGGPINICINQVKRGENIGVQIVVEDFGRGMSPVQSSVTSGLGLAILTRTISFINMYNNADPLDMLITDKSQRGMGQGVRVEFFIPKLWKSPFLS